VAIDDLGLIVGFCTSSGCAARVLSWWGGLYFDHATTLVPESVIPIVERPAGAGPWVIDARVDVRARIAPGVRVRPAVYLQGEATQWVAIPASRQQKNGVYEALVSQIGKPYDRTAILDQATGAMVDRHWTREDAWDCSELMVWSWIKGVLVPPALFGALTPNRLAPGVAACMAWTLRAVPTPVLLTPSPTGA